MGRPSSLMPRRLGEPAPCDRLAWRAGTCLEACGVRMGVRVNDTAVLARLPEHFPPGWRPSLSADVELLYSVWVEGRRGVRPHRVRIYSGPTRRADAQDVGAALALLEAEMRQGVAAAAPERIFVHAGVVGWRGRAILLPGQSRSGKSTLVAELLRAGADYLSDEFAVLDARGRVHPFAKPLSIRVEGRCDRHARREKPEAFGACAATRPLPVGLVAFCAYRKSARWRPVELTPGQAVLQLLAHTVPVRLRPAESLGALARVATGATRLKGERGDAAPFARALLRTVGWE